MTKEDFLKKEILANAKSIMAFAKQINIPYTTIKGMLTRGVDGASVQTIIKVCNGLDISIDYLMECKFNGSTNSSPLSKTEVMELTPDEHKLLEDYRSLNKEGKTAARNMLRGLTIIPEYKKPNESKFLEKNA